MAAVKIPKIQELPKDGLFWRVDWLGALEPNPQITTEPFFQIIISPFHTAPCNSPKEWQCSIEATDVNRQKTVRIGIGQLPLIDIGSIWRNGVHQDIYAGVIEKLDNLQINEKTVNSIPAVHKVDGLCIIPFRYHRIGKAGAGSSLLAVEHNGDPYGILIPAIELIRFYYAISTHLAHALFSGAFQHNPDLLINTDRTWYRAEDDRVFLGLRQQITDEEGWVIARILHSKIAAEACRQTYDSVVKDALNKKYINVSTGFPFAGETSLTARVKRVPGPDGAESRRLVLGLVKCSASMPYSNLTIIRDNDANQANESTDIPESQKTTYARPATASGELNLALQSEKDTSAAISNAVLKIASNRFSALEGRKPDKPTKKQCEYRSGGLSRKDFAIDALGTSLGSYSKDERAIQRLNIAPERNRKKAAPPSFELFIEAISHLNQYEGVSASIRHAGPELRHMPLIKPSDKWQWGYLDSRIKQRRNVVIADIYMNGQFFSLIEFQQRENESYTACLIFTGGNRSADSELHRLLLLCSLKNGVWKNLQMEQSTITSLKHTWVDSHSFSDALKCRILS